MAKEKCGILVPFEEGMWGLTKSPCLKKDNHDGRHLHKLSDGSFIEWEDDYSCKCGCWDDYEEGSSEVCMVYSFIPKENGELILSEDASK